MLSDKRKNKYSAENVLTKIVRSGSIAHAYLFIGSNKEQMGNFAVRFAKTINCIKNPKGLDPCNKCLSCNKIDTFNHPDIMHLKCEGKSKQIKIDQIRNLKRAAYLKPLEAKTKTYIVHDADLMNHESFNCLLKILEEPPQNVVFVLLTVSMAGILPTIISRCHVLKFRDQKFLLQDEQKQEFVDEFLNADNEFSIDELKFIKRPKDQQLKTVDILLAYYRDMLVSDFDNADDILSLMDSLFKAKEFLQSNVNSKMVADYLLSGIQHVKDQG